LFPKNFNYHSLFYFVCFVYGSSSDGLLGLCYGMDMIFLCEGLMFQHCHSKWYQFHHCKFMYLNKAYDRNNYQFTNVWVERCCWARIYFKAFIFCFGFSQQSLDFRALYNASKCSTCYNASKFTLILSAFSYMYGQATDSRSNFGFNLKVKWDSFKLWCVLLDFNIHWISNHRVLPASSKLH